MKTAFALAASLATLAMPVVAHAAQADYFLKIEGIDGETKVASWSFGACNAGQCSTIKSPRDAASGLATGKRQHKPITTRSTYESDASAGAGSDGARTATYDLKTNKGARGAVATGDLDGDGAADLAFAPTQGEVSSFSLTFQKIEATWRKACGGKHFDKATLRSGADSFELSDVTLACTSASAIHSGPRQTTDLSTGPVTMVLTGGRIKDNKTGLIANLR